MPTYEYKCDACDFRFERFQPITAKPIRKCPHCGKNQVKRLISAGGGMIFKGSGFYITDYRDSKYKESAKADTASAGEPATAKGDKSEKTPVPAGKDSTNQAKPAPTTAKGADPALPQAKSSTKPAKAEKATKSETK
jgi:putative FmdB family regulatory protein